MAGVEDPIADAPCLKNRLNGDAETNDPGELGTVVGVKHLELALPFARFFEADVDVFCARFMSLLCRA